MASKIITVTQVTATSISVSIDKGSYYGVRLAYRKPNDSTSQTVETTGASHLFNNLESSTTYLLNAEYIDSDGTGHNYGTAIQITTLDASDVTYSLWGLEAGEDYIELNISIDPSPDDIDMRYEYEIFLKGDSDSAYWAYDFIGHDTIPNITETIKLLYGIESGTTYKIYANIWYNGSEMSLVGTTPVYTITTETSAEAQPSISIVSMFRTTTDFTITIRNTSAVEQEYGIMTSRQLDTKGNDVEVSTFSPNETKTFTYRYYSSVYHGYPFFVWFLGEHNGDDWYYPQKTTTINAEDGSKFKPLESTAGYSPCYIKLDITQDFPWDNVPYMLNTSSPRSYSEFCWKPYEYNTNSILNGHENIYQSNNYHVHSSTASMTIEMNLKYPCKISFNYANNGHYGYNPDSADYFYDEELHIVLDDTTKKVYNQNRDGAWVNYTVECAAGRHILILKYIKDEKYNRYDDCAYFADFKITPCIPEKWDWSVSNGNASDEQTQKSYAAIENRGQTSVFSYLVWNDMVNKVKHILDYINGDYNSGAWNAKYGCNYENTLMVDTKLGRTLTAKRFNSLRQNVDGIEPTNIGEVYSENPNYPVYGWYFTKLMQCVNTYIENNTNV